MKKQIVKSKTDRVIDGVCGGLAEYFGIDAVIVRLVFVILIFIKGLGLFLYLILTIIMPGADKTDRPAKETIRENVEELGEKIREAGENLDETLSKQRDSKRARWFGFFLILLGIIFLLDNFNMFWWLDWDIFLALLLIVIGAWMFISRSRGA
jgi:phage shock protein C